MSQLKERFESLLQEDNFVTEQLVKLEEKTGVRRELIAIGRSRQSVLCKCHSTTLQLATRFGLLSIGTSSVLLSSSLISQSSSGAHL